MLSEGSQVRTLILLWKVQKHVKIYTHKYWKTGRTLSLKNVPGRKDEGKVWGPDFTGLLSVWKFSSHKLMIFSQYVGFFVK